MTSKRTYSCYCWILTGSGRLDKCNSTFWERSNYEMVFGLLWHETNLLPNATYPVKMWKITQRKTHLSVHTGCFPMHNTFLVFLKKTSQIDRLGRSKLCWKQVTHFPQDLIMQTQTPLISSSGAQLQRQWIFRFSRSKGILPHPSS